MHPQRPTFFTWYAFTRKGGSGQMVLVFKQKMGGTMKIQTLFLPQASTSIHTRKICCLLA